MDSIFQLSEADRAAFLQRISHSFGCTFICLWSYLPPPSNCLIFMDGVYHEENIKQLIASSSSGSSLARRLFDEYRKSVFMVDNGRAPGFAFKNSLPYIEFKESELQTLASTQTQLQFYQEARIKKAVFMGCNIGEIELGMSIDTQVDMEMEMRNWFPQDFSQQALPRELPQPTDQNLLSSSSSSLRSLSIDSPEGAPFLYNITSTPYIPQPPIEPSTLQLAMPPLTPITTNPFQEAIQTLSQIRNSQFPTIESEDAAMTRAILAVISSTTSTSSSTSSHQPQQKSSAFKSYRSSLSSRSQITSRVIQKQNMLKRAIAFIRNSSLLMRSQEQMQTGNRPMSNQLQHMISERKRREKLNESFQALRSLLPPGSKKDKASVLSSTTEYLNSLKAEVEELTKRNQILEEAQLVVRQNETSIISDGERLQVRITNIVETTLDERILDLRVILRGECSLLDLAIRVLEFLKTLGNVTVLSVEGDTTSSVSQLVWRLKIEGGEWDEVTFREAVKRVIGDMAQ